MAVRSPRLRLTAALALALLASACGAGAGRAGPTASPSQLMPASATALPQLDYAQFKTLLGQLRGKPVLVNFWASWCGPCIAEAPALAHAAGAYQGRVQFLGVDILDQRGPARAFIDKHHIPYPSVFDPNASIRSGLGLVGQPVTIIYDAAGHQVFAYPGAVPANVLSQELRHVT